MATSLSAGIDLMIESITICRPERIELRDSNKLVTYMHACMQRTSQACDEAEGAEHAECSQRSEVGAFRASLLHDNADEPNNDVRLPPNNEKDGWG